MTTESYDGARNGLAVASLILGSLAVLFAIFIGGLYGVVLAILLGIAGIITGAIALKQIKDQGTRGKGFATTGIVAGSLAIVVVVLIFIVLLVIGSQINDVFNAINSSLTQ